MDLGMLSEMIKQIWTDLGHNTSFAIFILVVTIVAYMLKIILPLLKKAWQSDPGQTQQTASPAASPEQVGRINDRVNELVTKEQLDDSLDDLNQTLTEIKKSISDLSESIQPNVTNVALIKRDFENLNYNFIREISHIKQSLNDINTTPSEQLLKDIRESIHKIEIQLEKLDEFVRHATPEFRSYHKELSKEITDLSRDLALIERTLQSATGQSNPIRLR